MAFSSDPKKSISVKYEAMCKTVIQQNAFENGVCETPAILFLCYTESIDYKNSKVTFNNFIANVQINDTSLQIIFIKSHFLRVFGNFHWLVVSHAASVVDGSSGVVIAQPIYCGGYHYNDVIMGSTASQITSLTIVFSTVYSGADQRKHQSSASLAFVRWIHRAPRTNNQ